MSKIEIRFGEHSFASDNGDIWLTPYPNIVSAVSPISDSLEASSFRMRVRTSAFGLENVYTVLMEFYSTSADEEYVIDEGDIMQTPYAEPLYFYENGTLRAKFYVTSIQREGREVVLVEGTSAVGLLLNMEHKGGVYFGDAAGDIILDIVQGLPCQIAPDVYDDRIYGWLPATTRDRGTSARDNLQQVLFAVGACLTENTAGEMVIAYPEIKTTKTIPEARTFLDGRNVRVVKNRVSKISLIEHTYYASTNAAEEVVYDNTNGAYISGHDVIFDKPYTAFRGSGITINDSGANWANITGSGVLYGTPYVHIRRELTKDTGDTGGKDLAIKEATLVSSLNSASVLNRVANYYQTTTQNVDVVINDEQPGDFAFYHDAYGDAHSAFVSGVDETISSFRRGNLTMINDWLPTDVGNTYSDYFLLTAAPNGVFTIPTAHRGKRALAVLFGGAQGGFGGMDGEEGHSGRPYSDSIVSRGYGGVGGLGGEPGDGGGPGRYLLVDIDSLAASYPGSIGAGGRGGQRTEYGGEFEEGLIGGDTIFGDFTTADGNLLEGPYINMIDGAIYGEQGDVGNWGRDGGKGGDLLQANKKGDPGDAGEDYNSVWKGGAGGLGARYGTVTASGGGGGGAAYGSSAEDSTQYTDAINYATDGADAVDPAQADFYRGGQGGHGGGGGGGSSYRYNGLSANFRDPGRGGYGSYGGQGADGFVLVYV